MNAGRVVFRLPAISKPSKVLANEQIGFRIGRNEMFTAVKLFDGSNSSTVLDSEWSEEARGLTMMYIYLFYFFLGTFFAFLGQ